MTEPLPRLPHMPFPEMYATNAENFNRFQEWIIQANEVIDAWNARLSPDAREEQ